MKGKYKMKKIKSLILTLLLVFSCAVTQCTHVHDDDCGYNPQTDTGCTHLCEYEINPTIVDGFPGE